MAPQIIAVVTSIYHNRYNKKEKAWNIAKIAKMWHRDTNWANAVREMAPGDLLNAR